MPISDGTKIAAAIMAGEASRQQQALKTGAEATKGYNISGGIFGQYVHFLAEIGKDDREREKREKAG